MSAIESIKALEIIDSRGNPTVWAEITTVTGAKASAAVPSGASTGEREAIELRDEDPARYGGKGVLRAVANINNEIADALNGFPVEEQAGIDQTMIDLDGTSSKRLLGANAMLAVSIAASRTAALEQRIPIYSYLNQGCDFQMPVPMMNIINGGVHASNNVDFQEFMILPVGADTFSEAIRYGAEVFHALRAILAGQGASTAVGDEGGFAPDLPSNKAALDLIVAAVESAGFNLNDDIALGLDVASSEFFSDGRYYLASENLRLSSSEFSQMLTQWTREYPIISIEDGMDQNDWSGWRELTTAIGDRVQLVGDDLFVTDEGLLQRGIDHGVANSILIKINQIGTLTETFGAIKLAKMANYTAVVSHRSGETEDTTIADIAVAYATGQIKTGSLSRSDRTAKYNRLITIESELGDKAVYPGIAAFYNIKPG